MAGFDLASLGLKKFVKKEVENETQQAERVPSGDQVDVGGQADSQAAVPVAQEAQKPAGLGIKIGIKTVTSATPVASKPVATPDVFDLASTSVEPAVPTVIEPEDEVVIESSPAGMRAKLDRLDKMIIANSGVDQASIDTARNYVQDIMVELKTHQEYAGVLVANDVHNIMTFVRESLNLTQKTFQTTAEKRTKSAAKKAGTTKFDFSGVGDASLEAPKVPAPVSKQTAQLQKAAAAGLDAFANLNVDSILAKMRK